MTGIRNLFVNITALVCVCILIYRKWAVLVRSCLSLDRSNLNSFKVFDWVNSLPRPFHSSVLPLYGNLSYTIQSPYFLQFLALSSYCTHLPYKDIYEFCILSSLPWTLQSSYFPSFKDGIPKFCLSCLYLYNRYITGDGDHLGWCFLYSLFKWGPHYYCIFQHGVHQSNNLWFLHLYCNVTPSF